MDIPRPRNGLQAYYHRSSSGTANFGDDLNARLLPRLFPGITVGSAPSRPHVLLGFGTILNAQSGRKLEAFSRKIVFSSGHGYEADPARRLVPGDDWDIRCVRGPLSARALGLEADRAVTDGGCLVARHLPQARTSPGQPAFMPHVNTATFGRAYWQALCARHGLRYLDPRDPIDELLDAIAAAPYLVTEAMHGAIVADAYRTPWTAVQICDVLAFKWRDWCASLAMDYRPTILPPVWPTRSTGLGGRARLFLKTRQIERILSRLTREQPVQLSDETLLAQRLDELEARAAAIRRDYG